MFSSCGQPARKKYIMHKRLQALVIADSEDDAELMIDALRRGGFEFHHERVMADSELKSALKAQTWDLALCDYNPPRLDGRQALATITSAQGQSDAPQLSNRA
jgi:CheY-like chemotaxis protein